MKKNQILRGNGKKNLNCLQIQQERAYVIDLQQRRKIFSMENFANFAIQNKLNHVLKIFLAPFNFLHLKKTMIV